MPDFDGVTQLQRAAERRDQPFDHRRRGAGKPKTRARLELVTPSGTPAAGAVLDDGTIEVRVRGAYRAVITGRFV